MEVAPIPCSPLWLTHKGLFLSTAFPILGLVINVACFSEVESARYLLFRFGKNQSAKNKQAENFLTQSPVSSTKMPSLGRSREVMTAAMVPTVNKEGRPRIKYLKVDVAMVSFVSQEPFWNQ